MVTLLWIFYIFPVNVSSKDLLEDNPVLMLFHRIGVDCQFADVYHTCQVNEGRVSK